MTNNTNPLLDFSGLMPFDAIKPEHITPAIDTLLADAEKLVADLEKPMDHVTWDNFVTPLENATEKLGRAWSVVGHLSSVVDTPELRAEYNNNQPRLVEFWTKIGQNLALYEKYKAILNSTEFSQLSATRQKIIQDAVRDFRLSGAELPDDQKVRFAEIQAKLAALTTRFSENVLDATNHFSLIVEDEKELAGLPDDAKQAAQAAAKEEGKTGYKFTLHFPSFYPVLQYAENRALREKLYRANSTKASELGENPDWDNTQIIKDILTLRKEEAQLLGFDNYAQLSLVPKMANTPEEVMAFLEDLGKKAKPFGEKDYAELKQFAKDQLNLADLANWDTAYASEKLREQRYAFSEQEVKQYFPEDKVINGLFHLVEKLYGITIKPDTAPVWHSDVRFFRIERDNQLIGQFYMDLYARNGKRGGAWMDDARSRKALTQGVQTPIAYLVCNFTAPVVIDGVRKPSLLTHDEVTTVFHEFGHSLHHLLTQVDEVAVSGISGVEWDAVELPSQFMENFCWEWDVLQHLTAHTTSGIPLPRPLYEKMIAAKNFQSGLQTLRQVEFSLFDMRIHDQYDPSGSLTVQDVLNQVRKEIAVIPTPDFNRFQNGFSHIFAGGYAAGYYSYKWAEVLSADAYSAFEEAAKESGSVVSMEVGKRFQQEILSVGGSRPAIESFKAFRGREPQIDALLRHSGMAA